MYMERKKKRSKYRYINLHDNDNNGARFNDMVETRFPMRDWKKF